MLRNDADLIALVPVERNYGMRTPADVIWPFTSFGSPDALPFRGQCLDGATVGFSIHSFSKAKFEDECASINAVLASALDGKTVTLDTDYPAKAHLSWKGSQVIPDAAEASAWHGVNRFEATIAA